MEFQEFWDTAYAHPVNRGDKNRASLRFQRVVATTGLDVLLLALEGYKAYQKQNPWYSPAQLSTWLGSQQSERWLDWLPTDPVIASIEGKAVHKPHWCQFCGIGHYWECLEPAICGIPAACSCPEFAGRYSR